MNLVDRAKNIILTPKTEWGVIDGESHTVQDLYTGYVMILAAIPPICTFIGFSLLGMGLFGTVYRVPITSGIVQLILSYVLSLGSVYVLALIIDALAANFGGQKNFLQAFKVAAFAPTASWLAGIFSIIPVLSILGLVGLYSIYLLYTGLPRLMKAPEDKAVPYTVIVIIVAIVLAIIVGALAGLAVPGRMRGF
jgi:hypothetical protein